VHVIEKEFIDFDPEDGCSGFLQNVCNHHQENTMSQHRRLQSDLSPLFTSKGKSVLLHAVETLGG
jgi:hypothetical protein